jgi:hypothetical protein
MIKEWWVGMLAYLGRAARPFFPHFTTNTYSVIPAVIRTGVITTAIILASYSGYSSYSRQLFHRVIPGGHC